MLSALGFLPAWVTLFRFREQSRWAKHMDLGMKRLCPSLSGISTA